MFHLSYCVCTIFADKSSARKNQVEIFKKYAIVIRNNLYICSINMPYYAYCRQQVKIILKTR